MTEAIQQLMIADARRRLIDEGIARILKCVESLSDEEIWKRTNENSNAIGNLILHLNGNVRQWVFSGLLGDEDVRNRPLEFSQRTVISKAELKAVLDGLKNDLEQRLPELQNIDLTKEHVIQGISENGVSVIMHVVEHFSYHIGQIAMITKQIKNQQLDFYQSDHLNDLNQN